MRLLILFSSYNLFFVFYNDHALRTDNCSIRHFKWLSCHHVNTALETVVLSDTALVIGDGAYGVTEVTGGGLQTIVKQKGSAGTADPLDQRSSVGWKAIKTAELLLPEYIVRIESCSPRYSATVAAN